jgi:N-acetylmuramoyl-L-alanine amidase
MPSILVEVGFITNPAEEKRLKSRAYRKVLADGIAQGIVNYLAQQDRSDLRASYGIR